MREELERQHTADEYDETEPAGYPPAEAYVPAAEEHEQGQLDLVVPRAPAMLLQAEGRAGLVSGLLSGLVSGWGGQGQV